MKRSFAIVLLLASGLVLNAAAQTSTAPATASAPAARIAVIAFQVAVAQTNEGQRDFADLEKKFEPRRAQLKALSDEIDAETKELKADSNTLTDVERANRSRDIQNKQTELNRSAQDAQSDFQTAMQNLYTSLAAKVYDVMEAYAKEHGYTLVLDISQQQSPVLYATNSTNITKAVIDAYNLKSGIPAPPPQAGSNLPPAAPMPRTAAPTTAH
jgi:outer membrane protein